MATILTVMFISYGIADTLAFLTVCAEYRMWFAPNAAAVVITVLVTAVCVGLFALLMYVYHNSKSEVSRTTIDAWKHKYCIKVELK